MFFGAEHHLNRSLKEVSPEKKLRYDEIVWNKKSPLHTHETWERNKDVVKHLLAIGEATKITPVMIGVGKNVPTEYKLNGFDGIKLWFQPNLEFYDLNYAGMGGSRLIFKNKPDLSAAQIISEIVIDADILVNRAKRIDRKK